MRFNTILIHYGEIALKGRNRPDFQRQLRRNVVRRLGLAGGDWSVCHAHDHLYVAIPSTPPAELEPALDALAEVSGVVWYAPALGLSPEESGQTARSLDLPLSERHMVALARAHAARGRRFAVRVHRADKRVPCTSAELERRLGAAIIRDTDWRTVDLTRPDVTFNLDLQSEGAYVYAGRRRGPGGLPVGSAGRVLALLSGGLDSPVAASLAAKRGCAVDFIHFAASALHYHRAPEYKIARIVRHLSRRTLRSRLYLVPYTHFDVALLGQRTAYELVIFRRFMAATAAALAPRIGAQALVTGDNLGQVASQTLENIASFSRAVELPVLRPLITYDKQEIVDTARRIGTYDLSIEPYKDCCAIISRHPRTRSRHETLAALEHELLPDYAERVQRTLDEALVLEYECGERVEGSAAGAPGGERMPASADAVARR